MSSATSDVLFQLKLKFFCIIPVSPRGGRKRRFYADIGTQIVDDVSALARKLIHRARRSFLFSKLEKKN